MKREMKGKRVTTAVVFLHLPHFRGYGPEPSVYFDSVRGNTSGFRGRRAGSITLL